MNLPSLLGPTGLLAERRRPSRPVLWYGYDLEKDFLGRLKDQRGKFRSFLLTFLKHFLAEQRRNAGAQKRGGGQVIISLNGLFPGRPADCYRQF